MAAQPTRFRIRNWEKFQHYKDRNPPWIKLHVAILASEDWVTLPDASKLLAVVCMIVAAKHDGYVPNNPHYIRRVAYLNNLPNLKPLIECGFLEMVQADASAALADDSESKQQIADARPETETQVQSRAETEKSISRALREEFDQQFWPVCPRKVGKPVAFKAFVKARKGAELATLVTAMRTYAASRAGEDQQFTLHPRTWLSQERWNDETAKPILYANGHDPPAQSLESIIAKARTLDENPDVKH